MTSFTLFTPEPNASTRTVQYTVDLEGVLYIIRLEFNRRDEFWYFSLYDIDQNPIRLSVKMLAGSPLELFSDPETAPPGQFYVETSSGVSAATLNTISSDAQLVYYESGFKEDVDKGLLEPPFFRIYKILNPV